MWKKRPSFLFCYINYERWGHDIQEQHFWHSMLKCPISYLIVSNVPWLISVSRVAKQPYRTDWADSRPAGGSMMSRAAGNPYKRKISSTPWQSTERALYFSTGIFNVSSTYPVRHLGALECSSLITRDVMPAGSRIREIYNGFQGTRP